MYKYILQNEGDISGMALVPLVLFFMVFVGAMVWTMVRNRQHIEHMANLPFRRH